MMVRITALITSLFLYTTLVSCDSENNTDGGARMVQDFYSAYFHECHYSPDPETAEDVERKYCSSAFLSRLNDHLPDYDVFLPAQDCSDEALKTLSVAKDSTEAGAYIVSYLDKQNKQTIIRLKVIKESGVFKIDAVLPETDMKSLPINTAPGK